MPWYAYAYLALLALVGAGGFVSEVRTGRPAWLALVRLAATVVLGIGVVLYVRGGEGAGTGFAFALFLATLVHAQKAVSDHHVLQRAPAMPAPMRLAIAARSLSLLPAIALGALAVWSRQGV